VPALFTHAIACKMFLRNELVFGHCCAAKYSNYHSTRFSRFIGLNVD
jgi:hypothetical protein